MPLRARVYLWLIAAAGAVTGLTAGWAITHGGAATGGAPVLAQFALLAIAAQHFPLPLGPRRKFDLAQAAHFAIILLAAAPAATILVGASEAIGQVSLALRRDPSTGRRRRSAKEVLFNTSQVTVAAGLAAVVGAAIRAAAADQPVAIVGAEPVLRALALGATLYLANSAAVAVMVSLHRGRDLLGVWLEGRAWSTIQSGGLLVLGGVAAHTGAESPWAPLAMAVPAVLTYASLQRSAAAEAAVRLRDEFLGVASHELRTPVTVLRGYAQLAAGHLERGVAMDEAKLIRSLRAIDQESGRLSALIEQLLDLSRLRANRLAARREVFDLAELAREMSASLQPLVPDFRLVVLAPEPVPVWADRLRLGQVLTNLITNAARHGGVGDRIDVEVAGPRHSTGTPAARTVTLAVRDYGVGIPREHQEHIFQQYYQAGANAKAGGLGLGLYIARQAVELHGGTIGVECPTDGGTRFVAILPAIVPPEPALPAPALAGEASSVRQSAAA